MFRRSARTLCTNVLRAKFSQVQVVPNPGILEQQSRLYSSAIQTQCSRLRIQSLLYCSEVSGSRKRSLSSERRSKKVVPVQLTFQKFKEELKSEDLLIVDVREPAELTEDGRITIRAQNIPLGKIANSLSASDEEFVETYGFNKPDKDKTIIFHCKMGIRAAQAAHAYADAGYTKIKIYPGVVDWCENGGTLVKE